MRTKGAKDLRPRKVRENRWHRLTCQRCERDFVGRTLVRKYCDHPLCVAARALERKRKSLDRSVAAPPENPWLAARRRRRLKQQQAWKRENTPPERIRARKAVATALKTGELRRKRCEVRAPDCKRWPTTFHHRSYEAGHELDGVWACWPCHMRLHAQERRQEAKKRLQEAADRLSGHAGVIILED